MHIEQFSGNEAVDLALDTILQGKQALFFVNTKASAEKAAEDIAKALIKRKAIAQKHARSEGESTAQHLQSATDAHANEYAALSEQALSAASQPTKQCKRLASTLLQGIAFHHAGLLADQRELIEENFRSGKIKVICCTPTLAAGVDLPAFRAIIRDLKRFNGSDSGWGQSFIPVLEYHQMAGRAGRPGLETYGEAITIAQSEGQVETLRDQYLRGKPEEIYSKLAVEPVLRTYVLSLIATGHITTRQGLLDFFAKTFWAFQFEDIGKIETIIDKVLGILQEYEFIQGQGTSTNPSTNKKKDARQDSGFMTAADLLNAQESLQTVRATPLGERVAQLYIDPLTAHQLLTALQTAQTPSAFALLHLICSTLEMRPYLRVKQSEYQDYDLSQGSRAEELLVPIAPAYDVEHEEQLDAFKTACFLDAWMNEVEEEKLLEQFGTRPGETRYKIDRADWLLYSSHELARMQQLQPLLKEIMKVRTRLKYGAKEELLALLKLKGIGRVRARKLFDNGIKDLGDIKKASLDTLSVLIGKAMAQDIKLQIEQPVTPVADGKRKGQLGLGKYA